MREWNDTWHRLALLPLRLVVGYGFIAHGAAKWSRGPENFGNLLHLVGVPFPGRAPGGSSHHHADRDGGGQADGDGHPIGQIARDRPPAGQRRHVACHLAVVHIEGCRGAYRPSRGGSPESSPP